MTYKIVLLSENEQTIIKNALHKLLDEFEIIIANDAVKKEINKKAIEEVEIILEKLN